MKYFLISTIFLILSHLSYSQQTLKKNSLPGTYQFLDDDWLFRVTVVLNIDHSFYYDWSTDVKEKSSAGTWQFLRDTLVLNTYNQESHFKIKVKETKTTGKFIKFGDIKTSNGKFMPIAMVSINGDTTKLYDPLDTSYIFHPGDIKTLTLFIGRARSEKYTIRNLLANRIDINLDMDQSPTDYSFMRDAKFLVLGTSIFPIRGNQIDSITVNTHERVPIALMKIK